MTIYQIQHIFNNWFEKLEISKLTAGAVLTALVFFGVILIIRCVCLTDWYGMRLKIRRRFLLRRPKQQERGKGADEMGFKGCAFADKVLVLTGAVLSVLPLVFLISGAFMGESELGQIASPVISGGRLCFLAFHSVISDI